MKPTALLSVAVSCWFSTGSITSLRGGEGPDGALAALGLERGICAVFGEGTGEVALRLARREGLLVYTQLEDPGAVARLRAAAEAAGLGPERFQADEGSLRRIHLADDVADAVIVSGDGSAVSEAEALRVLRPRGKALLGARGIEKPVPEGVDDWSHPYHGPDNNPVSRDRTIRAPYLTQFFADPRYAPSPQAAVASAGRLFKAFGHVAWHEREEAFLLTLACFNGYNGTLLWRRKLPEGMMVHRNTFVATPEVLYVGDDASAKLIDAATGALLGEIRAPEALVDGSFWKWMALEGGVLYALVGADEQKDPATRWRFEGHGWPWDRISDGHTQPEHPWGFGRTVLAFDAATKAVLWHHREDEPADARTMCLSGGRLFAFRFGSYLTCLDARTGKVLYRKTPANAPELFRALGSYLTRQGWQTNWRTTVYLKASERALYFAGPQVNKLLAVSAADGGVLWEDRYNNFQLLLREDGLFGIGGGVWGENVSRKFDPLSGTVLAELPAGRRACTRPTATADAIFYRANGGSVRFDVAANRPRWISPMRPPCHDGVTIANGRLYWSPWACDCQLSICGLVAVGSARDFDFRPRAEETERLDRAPGSLEPSETLPESPLDWPTFRANAQATCTTRAKIPERASVLWKARPFRIAGTRPTAPTIAGGRVFVAGSDGSVRSLDLQSGEERWRVATGGEVRIPPSLWKGRALVGSGDGWVYALEAATGRRLWRFRAAPAERKIPVFGKLLSTWPAGSGVLVGGETAYVAAGIVNYDGTYVYALDPRTGSVKWLNDSSGHLDPEARTGASVQGHLLLHEGKLYMAGGNAVSPAVYDARDGRCLNDPAPLARCESTCPRGWELFLLAGSVFVSGKPFYAHPDIPVYDHTVTSRLFHASNGRRDVLWVDLAKLHCFRPIAREALERCIAREKAGGHIIPTWGRVRLEEKPLWSIDTPGAVAAALAENAVALAGGAFAAAYRLEDGKELWRQALPAPAVPWGLAVGPRGEVVLTLASGEVLCVGG